MQTTAAPVPDEKSLIIQLDVKSSTDERHPVDRICDAALQLPEAQAIVVINTILQSVCMM